MRTVSREEFFTVVNQLNVGPAVDVATLKDRWHMSYWRMLDGTRRLIGRSERDVYGIEPARYFLA